MIEQQQAWEKAEIDRSKHEALHTPSEQLIEDEQNARRYLNPPLDTVYPLEYAYALLGDLSGRVILDFGCGSGQNSFLLARRKARVIGVDISKDLVDLAARRLAVNGLAGRAELMVGSAHDLPLQNESVDGVLGIAILHHLDLAASAKEIYRVLKPGGIAIFQEPVRDSALVRAVRRMIPYRQPDVSPYERPLTTPELQAFAAGFQIEAWRAFTLPFVSLVQVAAPLRRYVHEAYRIDGMLLKRIPSLSHLSAIRVLALRKPSAASVH